MSSEETSGGSALANDDTSFRVLGWIAFSVFAAIAIFALELQAYGLIDGPTSESGAPLFHGGFIYLFVEDLRKFKKSNMARISFC